MDTNLHELPHWAWEEVNAKNWHRVREHFDQGSLKTNWFETKGLRGWAKQQGWHVPLLSFQNSFLKQMVASEENFTRVYNETGLRVWILKQEMVISNRELQELDNLYEERHFRILVDELRKIRRAVQAGVRVQVDDEILISFQKFYDWAHGRYYLLEDDPNTGWIGDDGPHRY